MGLNRILDLRSKKMNIKAVLRGTLEQLKLLHQYVFLVGFNRNFTLNPSGYQLSIKIRFSHPFFF
jgi:hypothetical protein